jgi:eukaryotic-like serine/threonine-protein kinase
MSSIDCSAGFATPGRHCRITAGLMPLSAGARLGSYEILSALGAGGMGEVYRARDTRLDRLVAIKILPEALVADAERVARFQREARVLASLNHPHIAAIYGLDEADGVRALVMELVEGEDLARRLTRGAIPLDEALPIAKQIAEALEAAHEQGIIHRDLKPANITVRPDGTVKVLDFGLAKVLVSDAASSDVLNSPTITELATRAGVVLGTAPYMSPEQARGRPVERRTDVWAFGAVLYELLTGKRAFPGESVTETLSHVLTLTPDWTLLPSETPAAIRTLLRRCLEKNPGKRLDSAVTLRIEIDEALASPAGVTPAAGPQVRRRGFTWATIGAVAGASLLAALGTWAVMRKAPPAPQLPARFAITLPPAATEELLFQGTDIALSPDGRYLVYHSRGRLMLRALDQLDAVPLSNVTSGRTPFFSPDSRWIGFFDGDALKKVAVTGEPVITLCRELGSPEGGTWGDDGTIVISSVDGNIGLRRVSADGGEAAVLTSPTAPQNAHWTPSMLPGSRGVLFTIWASTREDVQLAVLDLKSGQQKTLLRGAMGAEYLETGHLVYATAGERADAAGTLWAIAFDLDRLAVVGEPVRVSETREVDMFVDYAVSRTGALAYVPPRAVSRSFVWVDRSGRETPIYGLPPRPYSTVSLSPDGTRAAFGIADQEYDIWTWDFARESLTRLTFEPGIDSLPGWTPDGRQIVFRSERAGAFNVYKVAADGSGSVERLTTSTSDHWPNSITPDGTALLFCEIRPKTGYDILRLPLTAPKMADGTTPADERPSEAATLVATPFAEYAANISPDGRYFAYQSAEFGGRFAIYVRPYPDAGSGRWQISTEGGMAPVWAPTGRELFYLDESNTLMAVPVQTSGPQFTFGRPAKVFDTTYAGSFYSYDVTPDGRRFLMMKESPAGGQTQSRSIVLVLNWFEEVKRRVPVR